MIPRGVIQMMDSTGEWPVVLHLHHVPGGGPEDFEWLPEQAGRYVFDDHLDADKARPVLLANERARRAAEGRPAAKLMVYVLIESGGGEFVVKREPSSLVSQLAPPREATQGMAAKERKERKSHGTPATPADSLCVPCVPLRPKKGAEAWARVHRERIAPSQTYQETSRRMGESESRP